MNQKTLIIAEAGVNHNGDLSIARQLIDVAADAGADLVKFQTFDADQLVTLEADKAQYQKEGASPQESQYSMLKRLELNREQHEELVLHCKQRGIGFFSTGFDNKSIDYLASLGLKFFKVPSGEITNYPYLMHIGRFGKPIILSTGMSSLGDIERAIEVLESAGTSRKQITVLHCNTEYPTPMKDVNLRAMCSIRDAFGVSVGYSDHTPGIEVAVAAVALGAAVIEKHFTLDKHLPGPDHKASLEPTELKNMVTSIRNIEVALGDGIKRVSDSEQKNIAVARKSIVAARVIKAGETFKEENLTVKRPGTGISPMMWEFVIGRKASRDFQVNEAIEL